MDYVSKHCMTNRFRVQSGTLDGFLHDFCGKHSGRNILQSASELADSRAHRAEDDDFTSFHLPDPLHLRNGPGFETRSHISSPNMAYFLLTGATKEKAELAEG